jgi:hypothetical protein
MKVAELQRFLGNFIPFAKAAGASEKVATEFDRTVTCLEPFKEKTLAEFNEFLRRADEYDRTGKLTPPSTARPRAARTPKAPKVSVEEAAQMYRDLHARATDPALTFADIEQAMQPLNQLTVPQLKELARLVEVTVPAKGKKPMLEELARRVKELKASHERTQFRFGETG